MAASLRTPGRTEDERRHSKMKDNAREVLNLNDFLPLDGEDRLEISTNGGVLNLDIFYESLTTRNAWSRNKIFSSSAIVF
jgi:hypothetical protein